MDEMCVQFVRRRMMVRCNDDNEGKSEDKNEYKHEDKNEYKIKDKNEEKKWKQEWWD